MTWIAAARVAGLGGKRAFAAVDDPALPPPVMPGLFGSSETAVGDPRRYVPKSAALDRAFAGPAQPLIKASGDGVSLQWERMLAESSNRPPQARIEAVDRFVNSFTWIEDRGLYGQADYWATPAEFLHAQAGDCEDFAIAKYVALARVGFAEDRLRVALVHDSRRRLDHAVTVVYWGGDALVLDSLADKPASHSRVKRYRPICSFNRSQLWMHKPA